MILLVKKEIGMGTIETLQKASWRFVGNGYWLDPETKQKHLTSMALEIAKKRELKALGKGERCQTPVLG